MGSPVHLAVIALAFVSEEGELGELEKSQVLNIHNGGESTKARRHEIGAVHKLRARAQPHQLDGEGSLLKAVMWGNAGGDTMEAWVAYDGPCMACHLQQVDCVVGAKRRGLGHCSEQADGILSDAGLSVMHHSSVEQYMKRISHR